MEHGFREVAEGESDMAKSNFDHASAGPCFRLNLEFIATNSNQHAPLRPCVFNCDPHQGLAELVENDLAGYGLRSFDHCPEIQLHDRCANRSHGCGRSPFLVECGVRLVNLPDLAEGTPTEIAVAGVSNVSLADRLEPARSV